MLQINEISLNKKVSIYPNPVSEVLFLNFTEPFGEALTYKIIDLNGKVLQNGIVNPGSQAKINIHPHINGMVLLYLTSNNSRFVQKIIVL